MRQPIDRITQQAMTIARLKTALQEIQIITRSRVCLTLRGTLTKAGVAEINRICADALRRERKP